MPAKVAIRAVLSAIALMNRPERCAWYVTDSDCSGGRRGPGTFRRQEGGRWVFLDKQYHKTYAHSWRPIGQIALDMEQARMKQL